MNGMNRWRAILGGACALALGATAGRAEASAFQLVEQSGSGLGNAHSGQAAAAEDASTIFWNPAGLTRIPGTQFVASVSLVRPTTEFKNTASTPAAAQLRLGGNGGDASDLNYVPNAFLSWEVLPEKVWAGFGVSVPFGLKTEWDADWVGRFHAIKSEVQTLNFNPTVAWKLNEFLSVGAGANVMWLDGQFTSAANYSAAFAQAAAAGAFNAFPGGAAGAAGAFTGQCGIPAATAPAGCEGVADINADSWSWGWNVGVMFSLPTETRLGLSYRSSIEHDLEGEVEFSNRPAILAQVVPNGDVNASIELPDTASVALAQELGAVELLADFTWTGWSKLQELRINRTSGATLQATTLGFDDSWKAGLGANLQVAEPLKLRLGVAYDVSPVKDVDRTPRLPDQDRLWVATGFQWAFAQNSAIDVGFSWIFVKEGKSQLDRPPPPAPAAQGRLIGEYDNTSVWIAAAQLKFGF